jgi:soluble lytic murein transglycosylase-like protein
MKNLCNLKVLSLVIILFGSLSAFATVKKTNCLHKRNTICRNISKLNPKMDLKEAYKLSNLFSKISKKYKISADLLISIAFQESSFKHDAIRKVSGLVYDNSTNKYKKVRVGSDFCMMQIHISNIAKMDLKVDKLLKDPKYCIETGAKILSQYKNKYSKKEKRWWTHYNAKTKSKQNIYFDKVARHLKKINNTTFSAKRVIASTK